MHLTGEPMSRHKNWVISAVLFAIIMVCIAPAVVVACMPSASGTETMEAGEIVADVTQELPGGG